MSISSSSFGIGGSNEVNHIKSARANGGSGGFEEHGFAGFWWGTSGWRDGRVGRYGKVLGGAGWSWTDYRIERTRDLENSKFCCLDVLGSLCFRLKVGNFHTKRFLSSAYHLFPTLRASA